MSNFSGFSRRGGLLALVLVVGVVACSEGDEASRGASVPLRAVSPSGAVYQLMNANFHLEGPIIQMLHSDQAAEGRELILALPPGSYSIHLEPGWDMVRVQSDGTSSPVSAALAGPDTLFFEVHEGMFTSVSFSFSVDGSTVMLGEGSAGVGFDVDESGSGCTGDPEVCDGLDNDCDAVVDEFACSDPMCDMDGDMYLAPHCGGEDCDDGSPMTFPGAPEDCGDGLDNDCNGIVDDSCGTCGPEICDGIDNDCDGIVDNGCGCMPEPELCGDGIDNDCDGIVDNGCGCVPEPELCGDGIDNDCDGIVDDGCGCMPEPELCGDGIDNDCDGIVDNGCCMPESETCNGFDDDCDGVVDEATLETGTACGTDAGECSSGVSECSAGALMCIGSVDPTAEVCDGLDQDCDGSIDEGVTTTYYPDVDIDLFGDDSMATEQCTAPAGYTTVGGDCNDADKKINPGVVEKCDGIDEDCDGLIDEGAGC